MVRIVNKPKPSVETMEGPWKAAPGVTVSDKDGTYKPGETVPDGVVKANKWLVESGRVVGKPKKPKAKPKKPKAGS